ncbi:hypothetical protein Tco_1298040 [Tanacetum coccineum]
MKDFISLTSNEMVKDAIPTLGLADDKNPELTSVDLAHSPPLKIRYFSPTWKIMEETFKPSSIYEVPLTSYMRKVAKLTEKPLILPYEEVNVEGTDDKSSSRTDVQALKTQAFESQPTEETKVTANATQSLEASKSAEEQDNQPQTDDTTKVTVFKYKGHCKQPLSNFSRRAWMLGLKLKAGATFEEIIDLYDQKNKADQEVLESPFNIESEILIMKRFQLSQSADEDKIIDIEIDDHNKTDSWLKSIPKDDLAFISGFKTPTSEEAIVYNIHDTSNGGADHTLHASTEILAQSDPLPSVPSLIDVALKEKLPGLLLEALKNSIPLILKDSIKESVKAYIEEKLPLFDAYGSTNLPRSEELGIVIKTKMGKSVREKVQKGMETVSDKLTMVQSTVAINSQHVKDLRLVFKDMVSLLKAAEVFKKDNAEGRSRKRIILSIQRRMMLRGSNSQGCNYN